MHPSLALPGERQLAHARLLRARGASLPPSGQPSVDVLDSWARSQGHGLDFAARHVTPRVQGQELARRRERAELVRRLARAEMETLSQQIAGSNFLLAFADQDGVILDLVADNRFAMNGDTADIAPGSLWSEAVCGTNGLGTALASGRSVAISGLEHYFLALGRISCTATPVRDAHGELVGVLDASSCFESRQLHTQALVQMAATHLENGLMAHQMRDQLLLAIHPRAEFLGTLSAGLLVFDVAGRLLALNARGRQLLQGLDATPGQPFEALFDAPYERWLAQLGPGGDHRLRDRLGSVLVARCVHRPAPRAAVPRPIAQPEATADAAACAQDPDVEQAYATVAAAVRLKVPVLIHGETGSGKELLARHAHTASGRSGAFVAVNCGAMPAELFEAELFGHVAGAFTGARREGSPGLIASADGGTLLLDELGELPLPLQAALLRFLDDQQVRAVGALQSRRVDVQLVAASHVDLDEAVAARRFRADLLYRLNTVRVALPPLRQRRDFAAVARRVLADIDPVARLDDEAVARLARHPWPGNFRELRAVLTRALLASGRQRLGLAEVAPLLPAAVPAPASALQLGATELVWREFERSGRSVSLTSRRLGISRTTVYRHLKLRG